MKFLKLLVVIVFIALGAVHIAIATTQRELTTDTVISILLGTLFIAGAYGVYRDAKWGYYLSIAVAATGIAIALIQRLPIAVAMFIILATSTLILMKKELRTPTITPTTPTVVVTTKSVFVNEKRFVKKKE
ncbi:MAG: hypothetical protein LM568_00095 [Desulfurococcaceae archaeon]|nr:hypothetical protein [Desulfurococcaceae archaeon]